MLILRRWVGPILGSLGGILWISGFDVVGSIMTAIGVVLWIYPNRRRAFLAYLASVPFATFNPEPLPALVTLPKCFFLLYFLLLIADLRKDKKLVRISPVSLILGIFFMVALVSELVNPDKADIKTLIRIFGLIILTAVTSIEVKNLKDLYRVIALYSVELAILSWLSVAQFVLGSTFWGLGETSRPGYEDIGSLLHTSDGLPRPAGPFDHPNTFAIYLMVLLVVMIGLGDLVFQGKRYLRILLTVSIVTGMALTFSRSGVLGLGAGILILAIGRLGEWRKYLPLLVGIMMMLAVVYVLRLADQKPGPMGLFATENVERAESIRAGLRAIKAHPWLGIGPGSFRNSFREFSDPAIPIKEGTLRCHCTYIEIGAESGLLGLIIFSGAIIFAMVYFIKGSRLPGEEGRVYETLLGAFSGILIFLLLQPLYYEEVVWLFMGLYLQKEHDISAN